MSKILACVLLVEHSPRDHTLVVLREIKQPNVQLPENHALFDYIFHTEPKGPPEFSIQGKVYRMDSHAVFSVPTKNIYPALAFEDVSFISERDFKRTRGY